jgi:hypothetical protein
MLFNFRLKPLNEISSWGSADAPTQSWYGLTEGEYWIEVGDQVLFESHDEFVRVHGGASHFDYNVARLYQDVLELLPDILAPIPNALLPYVWGARFTDWNRRFEAWVKRSDATLDADGALIDQVIWVWRRELKSPHCSAPPIVRLWVSEDSAMYIAWRASHCKFEDVRMWSATEGQISMTKEQFIDEVNSFHKRFVEAMSQRVIEVKNGGLDHSIRIDLCELDRNQACLEQPISRASMRQSITTDWDAVANAMQIIERFERD